MTTLNSSERLNEPGRFLHLPTTIVGAGAAAVGALVYAERRAGYERWPSAPAEIVGIPEDAIEATVTFPGLGSIEGEKYAKCMRNLHEKPSGYVRHSTDGVSLSGIARRLLTRAPRLKRMHVGGHSMGGPHSLQVACAAYEMGAELELDTELELGRITLFGSPYDWGDVRNQTTAKIVLGLDAIGWQGGPGTKQVVSTVKRALDGEGWRTARAKAKEDASGGCSPRTYPVMLRQFKRGPAPHEYLDELRAVVGEATEVDYIMPEDPEEDRTVWTPSASDKYGALFGELGVPFRIRKVPGVGHADVNLGCAALLADMSR
jgi:hypothetical protein